MAFRKPKKEKEKDKQKQAENAEKKAGGGSGSLFTMFVMMLAVFLVGAGMVIGYFRFFGPAPTTAENKEPKKEKEAVLITLDLGDMVVNLADQDQSRFLKTKITLGYAETKEHEGLIEEKKAQVIEAVLLTLRKKTYEDVSPPGATDKLKTELIKAINHRLNADVVKEIYFTEYIVQ